MSSLKQSYVWFKIKQPKPEKEKISKSISLKPISHKKKNKRGFSIMALFGLILLIPILIVMYAVLAGQGGQGGFLSILTGGDLANCAGSATYNVTMPSDTMICTISMSLMWLVVGGALISAVAAIVYGINSGGNQQGGI